MDSAQRDVIELVEYAAKRLTDRMDGLDGAEWAWQPISGDAQVTIRWRLDHIVETLQDPRNRVWLGLAAAVHGPASPAESSAAALDSLGVAVREFVDAARAAGDSAAEPIGAVAGPYGESTRRSFVLHIADELVHHDAEASLLRDLYSAR